MHKRTRKMNSENTNPHLWSENLYAAVLESGTGSGSLTHALARAVGPGGRVHTFEFHSERTAEAAAEFTRHKLSELVSIEQRNIELLGFPGDLHGTADAVFLDLPGPWKVILNFFPSCSLFIW